MSVNFIYKNIPYELLNKDGFFSIINDIPQKKDINSMLCKLPKEMKFNVVLKKLKSFIDDYSKEELTIQEIDEIALHNMRQEFMKNIKNNPDIKIGNDRVKILLEEILLLIVEQNKYGTSIEIINNDIFSIVVKMRGFVNKSFDKIKEKKKYDYVLFKLQLHKELYPYYPPIITFIKPRLVINDFYKISNLRMLQLLYWTPVRTLSYIINNIRTIIDKSVTIDVNGELNIEGSMNKELKMKSSYTDIEYAVNEIIEIDNVKGIDDIDPDVYPTISFDKDKKEFKGRSTKGRKTQSNGVGYGDSSMAKWDVEKYVKVSNEKQEKVTKRLTEFCELLKKGSGDDLMIIKESPLIKILLNRLDGVTTLEIERYSSLYRSMCDIIEIMANNKKLKTLLIDKDSNNKSIMLSLKKLADEYSIVQMTKDEKESVVDKYFTIYNKLLPDVPKNYFKENKISNNVYESTMTKYRLTEYNCDDLKGKPQGKAQGKASKFEKMLPAVQKRVISEIRNMGSNVPIYHDSSIYVKFDPNNTQMFTAMITGPKDTPYHNGCFVFQLTLPYNYPQNCPHVLNMTTNNGSAKFNPNLHAHGEICLSLLGTFSGEGGERWNPEVSTIMQILISIQSLILVKDPYYNETGREMYRKDDNKKKISDDYNEEIKLLTMKHAILDYIKNPVKVWKEIMNNHFFLKKDEIYNVCKGWTDNTIPKYKKKFEETLKSIKDELTKLRLIETEEESD